MNNSKPGDIVLVQGPPGTGKTETITGIISMILQQSPAGSSKVIHVCAPSNTAVDEILTRIRTKGLVGYCSNFSELKKLILRVGAPEY